MGRLSSPLFFLACLAFIFWDLARAETLGVVSQERVCAFKLFRANPGLENKNTFSCDAKSATLSLYQKEIAEIIDQAREYCADYYLHHSYQENDPKFESSKWKENPEKMERELIRPWVFQVDRFLVLRKMIKDFYIEFPFPKKGIEVTQDLDKLLAYKYLDEDQISEELGQWFRKIEIDLVRISEATARVRFSSLFVSPSTANFIESGQIHEDLNDLYRAEIYYEKAIRTDPKNADGWLKTVSMHRKNSNFLALSETLRRIDLQEVPMPEVELEKARAALSDFERRPKEAMKHYLRVMELDSEDLEAKAHLAILLIDQKHFAAAFGLAEKVFLEDSTLTWNTENLAYLHYRKGNYADALRLYQYILSYERNESVLDRVSSYLPGIEPLAFDLRGLLAKQRWHSRFNGVSSAVGDTRGDTPYSTQNEISNKARSNSLEELAALARALASE